MRIVTATNGADEFALVVEVKDILWYMVIYRWEEGWMFVGEFQMGLEGGVGHVDALVGTVVDVGVSISGLWQTTLVVEIASNGFWYILYSLADDGVLPTDELLSEIRMVTGAHEVLEDE